MFKMKFQLGVDDPTKGCILDGFKSKEQVPLNLFRLGQFSTTKNKTRLKKTFELG